MAKKSAEKGLTTAYVLLLEGEVMSVSLSKEQALKEFKETKKLDEDELRIDPVPLKTGGAEVWLLFNNEDEFMGVFTTRAAAAKVVRSEVKRLGLGRYGIGAYSIQKVGFDTLDYAHCMCGGDGT
jgi:hypothetical protein